MDVLYLPINFFSQTKKKLFEKFQIHKGWRYIFFIQQLSLPSSVAKVSDIS